MSKIEQLIQQLCPEGVEYKKLGEVRKMRNGTAITKKDAAEGDIPHNGGGMRRWR